MLFFPGCRREAAPSAGASAAPPTITFWTTEGYQPEEVEVLRDLATRFEQRTGTHVVVEFFTWDEINSKYLAALGAHRPPNIGQHGPDLPLRLGQEGAVVPADELITALGRERFYPEFLDAACRYAGHYWSVPWFIEVRALLIRTDWLAEAGLEPPRTWDEWLNVCRAFTRDTDADGQVDRWGFGLYGRDYMGQGWTAMAAQNDGGLFAADGTLSVDSPQNVEALGWYCDLYLRHQVTPPGTRSATWTDANAYYKRGLVGSLVTNGYILNELRKEAPDVLTASRFVLMPARRAGGRSISYLGGSQLMLFREAPHAERAVEFVRFLFEENNYLRFLQSAGGGALPALRDVARHASFQDDPNLAVLIAQIDGAVRHGYRAPPHPAMGAAEGERIFGAPVEAVLTGRQTPAQALHEARQRCAEIFERMGGGRK